MTGSTSNLSCDWSAQISFSNCPGYLQYVNVPRLYPVLSESASSGHGSGDL